MAKKDKEPQFIPSALNTPMTNYRSYYMNLQEKLLTFLAAFAGGGLVGLTFYGGQFKDAEGMATTATGISNLLIFAAVGLLACAVVFPMRRNQLRDKRKAQLTEQFGSLLDTLAISLSSGMNMTEAMQSAYTDMKGNYTEHGLITAEVREMLRGMENNIPLEDMLQSLGERSGIEDIRNFGIVFGVCYRAGGNMSDIVHRTNRIIHEKAEISREIDTALASNRTQFNAMMIIPVVLMLMLRLMSSTFAASFATPVGVTAITIAIGMFIGAYLLGQRIMDVTGKSGM